MRQAWSGLVPGNRVWGWRRGRASPGDPGPETRAPSQRGARGGSPRSERGGTPEPERAGFTTLRLGQERGRVRGSETSTRLRRLRGSRPRGSEPGRVPGGHVGRGAEGFGRTAQRRPQYICPGPPGHFIPVLSSLLLLTRPRHRRPRHSPPWPCRRDPPTCPRPVAALTTFTLLRSRLLTSAEAPAASPLRSHGVSNRSDLPLQPPFPPFRSSRTSREGLKGAGEMRVRNHGRAGAEDAGRRRGAAEHAHSVQREAGRDGSGWRARRSACALGSRGGCLSCFGARFREAHVQLAATHARWFLKRAG